MQILGDFSECHARLSLSQTSFEITLIEETRLSSHEVALAVPSERRFANVANFSTRIETSRRSRGPRGPRFATDPFFSSRISLPRARRSPRARLDTRSRSPCSVTQPRLHDTTASSFRSRTPLFLPSHAELRTRRSVKRSISFGDHAAPDLESVLSRRSRRLRCCDKRDLLPAIRS